jgi:hypothetical protein
MSETVGEVQQIAASSSWGINLDLFKMGPILHVLIAVSVTTAVMVGTGVTIVAVASGSSILAPIAKPDIVSTYKTTPVNIFPLSNDVDPKNGKLTLTYVQSPPYGTNKMYESTYLVYTPQLYWAGQMLLNYTCTNSKLTASSNITIIVKNHPPEPACLTYTISKNSVNNVANIMTDVRSTPLPNPTTTLCQYPNTVDVDNDILFITRIVSPPSNGIATVSTDGKKILYTPNPGYINTDSLVYEISDYNDTAQAQITYTIIVDPPTAVPDFYNEPRNQICNLNVMANDYDIDGDPITISSVYNSGIGKAAIMPNNTYGLYLQYQPQFGVYSDSFEYTITNGLLFSTTYVVINMVASPPVAAIQYYTVGKNSVNDTIPFNYSSPDSFTTLTVTFPQMPSRGQSILLLNPIYTASQLYPGQDVYVYWYNNLYTLLYTPLYNDIGLFNYTYVVSDGYNSATGYIYVNVVNQPPVAVNDYYTTSKNNAITVNPLSNDYDPNFDQIILKNPNTGNPLTTVNGGTISWVTNSTVLYTPPHNFIGVDSVVYTIQDVQLNPANNLPASATIYFTVNPSPPNAVNDYYYIMKGTPIFLNVMSNDFDINGDTFYILNTSATTSYGTYFNISTVNGVTEIFYNALNIISPPGNNDTFQYTIVNADNLVSTATVSVQLVNAPPIPQNDYGTCKWNNTITVNVIANDTDPNLADIPNLFISRISTPPSFGTAQIIGSNIYYVPNPGFVGVDTLQYYVNDLIVDSVSPATVYLTVTNNPPQANPDFYTVYWGQVSIFNVIQNDNDPDGDPIAIISTNYAGTHGVVSITNNNQIQFNQTDNYVGTITFTYTITDWNKVSTTTVTVYIINIPPQPQNDYYTMYWHQTNNLLNVLNNDVDPRGLSLNITSNTNPVIGTAVISNNQISFSNNQGLGPNNGNLQFQYTVSNGGSFNNTGTATVFITLVDPTPPVSYPVIQNVHWRTYYTGLTLNVQPSPYTQSGDPIYVYITSPPNQGGSAVVQTQAGNVQTIFYREYQSSASGWNYVFTGTEILNFTLSDIATNSSNYASITTYNNAPTAQSYTQTVINQGTTITIPLSSLIGDPDPQDQPYLTVLNINNINPTVAGTASVSNNILTFHPTVGFNGTVTMNYTVTDGLWNATNVITLIFVPSNLVQQYTIHWSPNPPTTTTYNITSGFSYYLQVPFTISQPPMAGASVSLDTNYGTTYTRTNVIYIEKANYTGSDTYKVGYNNSGSVTNITVYVTITNTPPVALPIFGTVHFNSAAGVLILINCTDADGDKTYISSIGSTTTPANAGTATIQGNSIKYVPSGVSPYNLGNVQFSYTCTDGLVYSSSIVTVTQTDNAPYENQVYLTYHWRVYKNATINLNLVQLSNAGDPDGDTTSLSGVGSLSNSQAGSVGVKAGLANLTASTSYNFVGSVNFPFTITDGPLQSTNTCFVTVYNTAPVAQNDYYTLTGKNPSYSVLLNVLQNDYDNDTYDQPFLTFVSSNPTSNPSRAVVSGNQILYTTPAIGFVGVDSFTYTITDGIATATATVYVTITASNPIAVPDYILTSWNQTSGVIDVTLNDTGVMSNVIYQGLTSNPSWGTVNQNIPSYNYTGKMTYTPYKALNWVTNGRNQVATDQFTYTIQNNYTLAASTYVYVTITNVIPLAVSDVYTYPASYSNPKQTLNVMSNDNSGDSDTISISSINTNGIQGTVTTDGSFIYYTPKANFFGTDTFTYTITDTQATSTANVTVTITPPTLSCQNYAKNITKEYGFSQDLSLLVTSSGGYPLTYTYSNNSQTRGLALLTGTVFSFQSYLRHSTPPTQVYPYYVQNVYQQVTCYISVDFYNSPPYAPSGQVTITQPKGTKSFSFNVLQNWTDPNAGDIPYLTIASVTNTSCAGAVISNNSLIITMKTAANFTGLCVIPYTVCDNDLNNPLTANSSIAGLLVAIVTSPPVAVNDYVYVPQGSGPYAIPISFLLSNDYPIDVGAQLQFDNIVCGSGQCAQTPYISGNYVIWPNSNPLSCNGDYFNYIINEVGAPTLTAQATVTIVITNCVCINVAIDIIFAIDGSGSISSSNWLIQRQFLANVTTFFDIGPGPNQVRIGAQQFSTSIQTHIAIYSAAGTQKANAYTTLSQINQMAQSTATNLSLATAMQAFAQVTSLAPNRTSVAKVIVMTTDGCPNEPCSCSCCTYINQTQSINGCSNINGTAYASCTYSPASGQFCMPCADPIPYANYINSLRIKNNNSNANYKIVAMGIGDYLTQYNNFGWNIVKQLNYDPNLAIQVSWANLNQAVNNIVSAACNQN